MTLTYRFIILSSILVYAWNSYSQTFSDIAPDYDIVVANPTADYGCGVSFADFDMDGWDDVTLGTKNSPIRFYRNNEGVLESIILPGVVTTNIEIKQIIWVDYDNDGDRDLFLGIDGQPYRIFRNNGDMTFEQLGGESGLVTGNYDNRNICWADYDRDGDLDVYLGRNQPIGSGNYAQDYPRMNHLYRNDDGYFVDVTEEAGVSDSLGITYGTVWWDYDADGWPDLYVVNDKWFDNGLYHNNGDGTFTELGEETGLDIVLDGMCASPADYDNDGDFDMYMTNTYIAFEGAGNVLMENNDGYFSNVAPQLAVNTAVFQCWGAGWLDYDNDGWQDLYVSTRETSPNYPGMNRLFKNQNGTGFTLANSSTGLLTDVSDAFVNAIGDLDNDGYPDIISQATNPFPTKILLSSGGSRNYLKVALEGVVSNKEAIGSLIRCYTNGVQQIRYTTCGESYMSQNSYDEIFGLGFNSTVDSLIIEWPSGHIDRFYNLDVNQKLEILEGSSLSVSLSAEGTINLCEATAFALAVVGDLEVEWNTGSNSDPLIVTESGTYYATVYNELGIPVQSDPVEIIFNPIPEVQEISENCSCPVVNDGSIELISNSQNELFVLWGDGEEGLERMDLAPGYYSYSVEDEYGCSSSGLIQIESPEEIILSELHSGTCELENEGSITITSDNYDVDEIYWDNEMQGTTIDGLAPGTYTAEVIFLEGCSDQLTVQVEAYPQNSIDQFDVIDLLCNSDSSGSIQLTPIEDIEIEEINWSGQQGGLSLENIPAGTYSVTCVNSFGCSQTEEVIVSQPDEIQVEIFSSPITDELDPCYNTYSGYAEVQGGTEPYSFLWTHVYLGESTQIEEPSWSCLGTGWLALNITDANGCIYNSSLELEQITSVEQVNNEQLEVYPNPVVEQLFIRGVSTPYHTQIIGSDGRILLRSLLNGDSNIEVSKLAQGSYILILSNNDFTKRIHFIKQ